MKPKSRSKVVSVGEETDDAAVVTSQPTAQPRKQRVNTDVFKARLGMIIDLLEDTDDDTLKKNSGIALKQLKMLFETL